MCNNYYNEYDEEEGKPGFIDIFRATLKELKDTSPAIVPVVTYGLIIANVVWFIVFLDKIYGDIGFLGISAMCFLGNPFDPRVLYSMFTHAGLFHLLGNMFYLYVVGDNVEAAMGRARYLFFYILCGYIATAIQSLYTLAFDPSGLTVPMVGASGAIAGVIGAYLYLYPSAYKYQCICFKIMCYCFRWRMKYEIFVWVILQFILPFIEPRIAVFAHIGGFLTGVALAPYFVKKENIERIKRDFLTGYYRGLKPDIEAVRKHTFGVIGCVVVILVASSVATVAIYSLTSPSLSPSPARLYYIRVKADYTYYTIELELVYNPYNKSINTIGYKPEDREFKELIDSIRVHLENSGLEELTRSKKMCYNTLVHTEQESELIVGVCLTLEKIESRIPVETAIPWIIVSIILSIASIASLRKQKELEVI